MRASQVEWAKLHDWFASAREVDGIWFVTVLEVLIGPSIVTETGRYERHEQLLEFKYFGELKAWAGY